MFHGWSETWCASQQAELDEPRIANGVPTVEGAQITALNKNMAREKTIQQQHWLGI